MTSWSHAQAHSRWPLPAESGISLPKPRDPLYRNRIIERQETNRVWFAVLFSGSPMDLTSVRTATDIRLGIRSCPCLGIDWAAIQLYGSPEISGHECRFDLGHIIGATL